MFDEEQHSTTAGSPAPAGPDDDLPTTTPLMRITMKKPPPAGEVPTVWTGERDRYCMTYFVYVGD